MSCWAAAATELPVAGCGCGAGGAGAGAAMIWPGNGGSPPGGKVKTGCDCGAPAKLPGGGMPPGTPKDCTSIGRAAGCGHALGGLAASPCSAPCSASGSEGGGGGGGGCCAPNCGRIVGRLGSGKPRTATGCTGRKMGCPCCTWKVAVPPGWLAAAGCTRWACSGGRAAGWAAGWGAGLVLVAAMAWRAAFTTAAAPGGSTVCARLSTIRRNCGQGGSTHKRAAVTAGRVPAHPANTSSPSVAAWTTKHRQAIGTRWHGDASPPLAARARTSPAALPAGGAPLPPVPAR